MAVTPGQKPKGFTEIDPTEEATIRHVDLWAPDSPIFDLARGELIYDRPIDTLLILFHGRGRDSFAVNVAGDYLVLADSDTDEIVGIQVEDFLYSAVKEEPSLMELLEVADLRGMTVEDVRQERHRVLGYRGRFKLWLDRMVGGVARRGEPRRQSVIEALLSRGRLGATIKDAIGSA